MLPSSWVDSLFARLQVRYGASWGRMWEGLDIAAVKSDWAAELAGYANRPEAIKHGLNHLPVDFPPNVKQFALLCRGAPVAMAPKLAAPPVSAQEKQRICALLAKARTGITRNVSLVQAQRLAAKEKA